MSEFYTNSSISETRRDALLNHFNKGTQPAKGTSTTIVMEELLCQLNVKKDEPFSSEVEQYYMCILEYKTTIYSTNIKMANEYGCIGFGDRFIFENVTNTSAIKVRLYSLTVKLSTTKYLEPQRLPLMTLIGVARIGLFNAKYMSFVFENSEHQLHTTVRATLN